MYVICECAVKHVSNKWAVCLIKQRSRLTQVEPVQPRRPYDATFPQNQENKTKTHMPKHICVATHLLFPSFSYQPARLWKTAIRDSIRLLLIDREIVTVHHIVVHASSSECIDVDINLP